MSSLERQLQGYRLTTAEILYFMPDYKNILQTFVWQNLDIAPRYPTLSRFLAFWEKNLDGRLHRVNIASVGLISPAELRSGTLYRLQ